MSGSRVRLHDFYSLFVELRAHQTELPFEVGGATQMGQLGDHHNNQDAIALVSGRSHLVAVISDGCASAGARHSHNEVGAKIQAMLFANMAAEAVASGGVTRLLADVPQLEERLLDDVRALIATLSSHTDGPSDLDLAQSFFTATLLAAAIDAEKYVVLGCGDGVLWINDHSINFEDDEGRYPSELLFTASQLLARSSSSLESATETTDEGSAPPGEHGPTVQHHGSSMLRVLHEGSTRDLQRLFLASDGFMDVLSQFPTLLDRFTTESSHAHEPQQGYNEHLLTEFRRKFWYDDVVEAWALDHGSHDDRTFALIRRTPAHEAGDPCPD